MSKENAEGRKIAFIIDDDLDFLKVMASSIQHPAFEVRTFHTTNGYQAVDEVIKAKPAVVFIDFNLPRANGGQILPVLKSVPSLAQVPVYIFTGWPKQQVVSFLKDWPHAGVLAKGESLKKDILRILDDLAAPLAA